jgi:hypothetical protein
MFPFSKFLSASLYPFLSSTESNELLSDSRPAPLLASRFHQFLMSSFPFLVLSVSLVRQKNNPPSSLPIIPAPKGILKSAVFPFSRFLSSSLYPFLSSTESHELLPDSRPVPLLASRFHQFLMSSFPFLVLSVSLVRQKNNPPSSLPIKFQHPKVF